MEANDKLVKYEISMIQEFFKLLAEKLKSLMKEAEFKDQHISQIQMCKFLAAGNFGIGYRVADNSYIELTKELQRRCIPFLSMPNMRLLYIKEDDLAKIKEIHRDVHILKSNYYQMVEADELEAVVARSNVKDKQLLTIKGLNKYEMEVLKNKCNDITKGFMIGVKERVDQNGNLAYDVTVRTSKIYSEDYNETDFVEAYMRAQFSLYGPNMFTKMKQVDADEKMDQRIASFKKDPNKHYVASVDSTNTFLEFNKYGLSYYSRSKDGGYVLNNQIFSDDVNYESELQRYLDTLPNKVIFDNDKDLRTHLSTFKRNFNPERPEKSVIEEKFSLVSKDICDQIDKMIKTRIKTDNIQFDSPDKLFTYYQTEAANIMQAFIAQKILPGYETKDFAEMFDYGMQQGVSFNEFDAIPKSLYVAPEKIELHIAKKSPVKAIESEKQQKEF